MKATLNIDDAIMAELKCEAARQGRTMSELVETALHVCSPLNESGGESPPYQSSAAAEHSSMCRSRCPVPLHGKSQVLAVDTNVLYAADADSQFHTACRDWLERERARPGAWYQLVDPSAHDKPRAAIRRPARGEAWNFVAALLASPGLAVLVPTERLADIAEALTLEPQAWGNVSAVSTVLPRHLGMVVGATVILASPRALSSSNVSLKKRSGQSTMTEHPRISLAPDVLVGKPVIRGTRLSVEFVIGLMADGWSEADILGNYPGLTHDDIIACLAYARDTLSSEKVFPSAA